MRWGGSTGARRLARIGFGICTEDTMPRLSLIVIAALSLGFAPLPFPKPHATEADLKAIHGEWVRSDGYEGAARFDRVGMTIACSNEDGPLYDCSFTLDAATSPKQIDVHFVKDDGRRVVSPWIYRLAKDTLTIRVPVVFETRPHSFDGPGAEITFVRRKAR
jgi:uncharacterized protein (TIGR03067 family)